MSEDKRKYLEMIQSVISRIAGNQMQLRTWCVALEAIIGYAAAQQQPVWALGQKNDTTGRRGYGLREHMENDKCADSQNAPG